mgnify:CR=1 FL=1|tara:strand:- start:7204 stop:8109 length:906 start_codon:yes stop_codon:yes gene_type:complete
MNNRRNTIIGLSGAFLAGIGVNELIRHIAQVGDQPPRRPDLVLTPPKQIHPRKETGKTNQENPTSTQNQLPTVDITYQKSTDPIEIVAKYPTTERVVMIDHSPYTKFRIHFAESMLATIRNIHSKPFDVVYGINRSGSSPTILYRGMLPANTPSSVNPYKREQMLKHSFEGTQGLKRNAISFWQTVEEAIENLVGYKNAPRKETNRKMRFPTENTELTIITSAQSADSELTRRDTNHQEPESIENVYKDLSDRGLHLRFVNILPSNPEKRIGYLESLNCLLNIIETKAKGKYEEIRLTDVK